MKYSRREIEAAERGWLDGFTDKEMKSCYNQPYFLKLPFGGIRSILYYFNFKKSRWKLEKRIREGKAQLPGSVYNPELDDGRGT